MWDKYKYFSMRKAFTLTETLISLIVIGILGGVAVAAIWFFTNSYLQMDDYTTADIELEQAFQQIAREIALVGLGMPNNRVGEGSFALSFLGEETTLSLALDNRPIMALFGYVDDRLPDRWGGPVTVSSADAADSRLPAKPGPHNNCDLHGTGAYVGSELFYAWAVPTGVRVTRDENSETIDQTVKNRDPLTLRFFNTDTGTGANALRTFRLPYIYSRNRRDAGIVTADNIDSGNGRNMRTWLLLPTLQLPLRADRWDGDLLDVTVAPVHDSWLPDIPDAPDKKFELFRTFMDLDEVHLVQAARIFLRDGVLVKQAFGQDYASANPDHNPREEELARNIVGLRFAYNPETRILQMHIAARGRERDTAAGTGQPARWPDCLPELRAEDVRYRVLVKNVTWRIRN